jgi:acetoacetyl-CoA reductase
MGTFNIMKEKVAVITGGMGGIGQTICQHLCAQGARVITSYNRDGDHAEAQHWQKEQLKLGYDIALHYVDVKDFASCAKMVQDIETDFGRIDILVNNAGITRDVQLCKMDLDQWNAVIQTNLNSIFNVTRHVINGMIARQYGRVINISSINGQKGQFGQTNYAAAKAGIHGFTKSLALEVARKGITVNTISPGYVGTDMVMAIPADIREKIITQIPVGRLGQPAEIARVVSFLASSDSSFITGANIAVNGGQYLL